MIDPKKQHELDECNAFIVEYYPPLWRQLYLKSISEGFTETQAFELVKTYIISQGSGDKKAP